MKLIIRGSVGCKDLEDKLHLLTSTLESHCSEWELLHQLNRTRGWLGEGTAVHIACCERLPPARLWRSQGLLRLVQRNVLNAEQSQNDQITVFDTEIA